jgi:hypothetical protein
MSMRFIFYAVLFYIAYSVVKRFMKALSNSPRKQETKGDKDAEASAKYRNAIDADFEEIKDK